MKLRRRETRDAAARFAAFEEAVGLADGRLDDDVVGRGREVIARGGDRLRLGSEWTVVALAGATGSGKSSLFNALAGTQLSEVGVTRPTTGTTHACVWGEGADALLDWVRVGRRYNSDDPDPSIAGLVLLDLPDHDSVEEGHRIEAERLVEVVDLVCWVLDPQKYADAALHANYLRGFDTHAGSMLFVLNQIDRLDDDSLRSCLADIHRLLRSEGFGDSPVLAVSARTGAGLGELKQVIVGRVAEKRAATERILADMSAVVRDLSEGCDPDAKVRGISPEVASGVVNELQVAAGVPSIANAVARSHRHHAKLATGVVWTRWLARLRPDPLKRMRLNVDENAVPNIPPPSGASWARVSTAMRALARDAEGGLPEEWARSLRARLTDEERELPDELERAVAAARFDTRRPAWWTVVSWIQKLLALVAFAGLAWLVALFLIAWLKLPDPPTYEVREIPLPTLMLAGGLLVSWLVAVVARGFARVGGARRARAARRQLADRIRAVATERVMARVEDEMSAYVRFCAALRGAKP